MPPRPCSSGRFAALRPLAANFREAAKHKAFQLFSFSAFSAVFSNVSQPSQRASPVNATNLIASIQQLCPCEYLLLAYRGELAYLISVSEESMSKPTDLVQGTLDLLLLKILALEPLNGFAVSQRLKQVSGDVLQVSDGSLYPALHKLEQEGWITAEWKLSENNRRAKFYSLTRLGKKHLEKESRNWNRLSGAITQVVKLKEA
jgi:PadR family transcriptional regulator, regulatory protein PadR